MVDEHLRNRASMYVTLRNIKDVEIRKTREGEIQIMSRDGKVSILMSTEVWSLIEYQVRTHFK